MNRRFAAVVAGVSFGGLDALSVLLPGLPKFRGKVIGKRQPVRILGSSMEVQRVLGGREVAQQAATTIGGKENGIRSQAAMDKSLLVKRCECLGNYPGDHAGIIKSQGTAAGQPLSQRSSCHVLVDDDAIVAQVQGLVNLLGKAVGDSRMLVHA